MFRQPEARPGAGSQTRWTFGPPGPGGPQQGRGEGGKGEEGRAEGRNVTVLKPGALIRMMRVNHVLWPDAACYLEAGRKVCSCLIPG